MRGILVALMLSIAFLPAVGAADVPLGPQSDGEPPRLPIEDGGSDDDERTPGGDPIEGIPGEDDAKKVVEEGAAAASLLVNNTRDEVTQTDYTCHVLVRVDSGYRGYVLETRLGEAIRIETTQIQAIIFMVTATAAGALESLLGTLGDSPFPWDQYGQVITIVEERMVDLELSAEWQEDYIIWRPIEGEVWVSEQQGLPFVEAGEAVAEEVCTESGVEQLPGQPGYFRPGGPVFDKPEDGWYVQSSSTQVRLAPSGSPPAQNGQPEPWPWQVAHELDQQQDDFTQYDVRTRDVDRPSAHFQPFLPFVPGSPDAGPPVQEGRTIDPVWIEPVARPLVAPGADPVQPVTKAFPEPPSKDSPARPLAPAPAPVQSHAAPLAGLFGMAGAVAVALARRRAA